MMRRLLCLLVLALVTVAAAAPAQAKGPRLLVYGKHDSGVSISRAPQVAKKLHGAPRGFKKYVRRTVRRLQAEADCSDAYVGVTVNRVRTDGFARGGINECGGYAVIWKKVDGRWREVLGTQEGWSCADLTRLSIPRSVVAPHAVCWDGTSEVPYEGP